MLAKEIEFEENMLKEKNEDIPTKPNISADNVADIFGLEDNSFQEVDTKVLSNQCIKHLDLELEAYNDTENNSLKFNSIVSECTTMLNSYMYLSKDIYLSLFKYKPIVKSPNRISYATNINYNILKKVTSNPNFKNLRNKCVLDECSSILGTLIFNEKMQERLTKYKKENKKKLDDMNALQKAEDRLKNNMQNNAKKQTINNNIKRLNQEINKANKNKDSIIDLNSSISKAIDDTSKELSQQLDVLRCWGLEDGDKNKRIPIMEKRNAISRIRNNPKLINMTKMIGRLRETATNVLKTKTDKNGNTIKSVEVGDKIQKILPTEKAMLLYDVTKKEFYKKYTQKQLMQYECESIDNKNKGPIVCCIDTSGSMEGKREIWSKAIAIAVLEIANKEKRNFLTILFSNKIEDEIEIPKKTFDVSKVIDIGEKFSSGGTNFNLPLKKAIEYVTKCQKYKKADILFITDGECNISNEVIDDILKKKSKRNFKILTVCLEEIPDSLKIISDKIININNLKVLEDGNSKEVNEILSKIK